MADGVLAKLARLETRVLARVPEVGDARRRGQALVRAMALFLIICLAWLPSELVVLRAQYAFVIGIVTLGLAVSLAVLARTGRVALASHGLSLGIAAAILSSARIEFGGAGLEVLCALVIVPFLAASFGGWKGGVGWALVSILLVVWHLWQYLAGTAPPVLLTDRVRVTLFATTIIAVVLAGAGLIILNELTHRRTRRDLEEALARARAADLAKSDFLANMSHEIRTPMNGVLGMLGLLLDGTLGAEEREFARAAHRSAELLLTLINGTLDFSKLEAGKLELEPVPADLLTVAEDVVEVQRGQAKGKGLELALRFLPSSPRRVRCDAGRLRQVLLNLVANAVKFTERGHVLLELETRAEGDRVAVKVRVEDTGVGIPADKLESVFEPFVQADASTTRRFGGTGLGLSIVRRLLEAMGGTVRVESAVGVGTTFTVELALPADPAGPGAPPPARPLEGVRVLLADGGPLSRRVLRELLEAWRGQVEVAETGPAAVEALRAASAAGAPFGVALVDEHLLAGGGLAEAVRGGAGRSGTALVVLTEVAHHDAGTWAHVSEHAVRVVKPARQEHLVEALHQALASRGAASPPPAPSGDRPALAPAPRFAGWRVLLADDESVGREVARRLLERLGCRVDTAANGLEAVALAAERVYDTIFLDCHMPELDGYGAAQAIRRLAGARGAVPIIALTADAVAGARERALDAGMNDHLAKPVRPPQLAATLERWGPRPTGAPTPD